MCAQGGEGMITKKCHREKTYTSLRHDVDEHEHNGTD